MNRDGGARGNTAYNYGFKAIKVPGERGDDGELTKADLGDAEQVEAALCLARWAADGGAGLRHSCGHSGDAVACNWIRRGRRGVSFDIYEAGYLRRKASR